MSSTVQNLIKSYGIHSSLLITRRSRSAEVNLFENLQSVPQVTRVAPHIFQCNAHSLDLNFHLFRTKNSHDYLVITCHHITSHHITSHAEGTVPHRTCGSPSRSQGAPVFISRCEQQTPLLRAAQATLEEHPDSLLRLGIREMQANKCA